jgi:hypothetical protein
LFVVFLLLHLIFNLSFVFCPCLRCATFALAFTQELTTGRSAIITTVVFFYFVLFLFEHLLPLLPFCALLVLLLQNFVRLRDCPYRKSKARTAKARAPPGLTSKGSKFLKERINKIKKIKKEKTQKKEKTKAKYKAKETSTELNNKK